MQTQGLGLQMMVLAQGHSAWDSLAYFSKVEENRYVTPLFFLQVYPHLVWTRMCHASGVICFQLFLAVQKQLVL